MSKTTLILGAGVSKAYGFPTGAELMDLIKKDKTVISYYKEVPEILNSGYPSIDLFLHEHKQFSEIIKGRIAKIIFEKEDVEKLNSNHENFYFHIFTSIPTDKYENYKIITFNYDRSLEFYFYRFLHNKLGDPRKALETAKKLEIIHIHGRVVSSIYEIEGSIGGNKIKMDLADYGGYNQYIKSHSKTPSTPELVIETIDEHVEMYGRSSFKTIHENSKVNERAKSILQDSDRIFFLGFQYAKENMTALGLDFTTPQLFKSIHGTCYGMGTIEQRRVSANYPAIQKLHKVTAYNFFKEYACIEDDTLDNFI